MEHESIRCWYVFLLLVGYPAAYACMLFISKTNSANGLEYIIREDNSGGMLDIPKFASAAPRNMFPLPSTTKR